MLVRVALVTTLLASAALGATLPGVAGSDTRASTPPPGAAPRAEQVLFSEGTRGYECFRIPAITRTTDGTLLAFAEARRPATHTDGWCNDAAPIDLVVRRSTDDGRSWGPMITVASGAPDGSGAEATRGNPVPIVVGQGTHAGRVVLLTTHNPAGGGVRTPYVQYSDDDGESWSEAQGLAHLAGDDGWYATGPSHGLQLTRGEHAGRLVAGVNSDEGGQRVGGVVYSDDGGDSWTAGASVPGRPTTLIPQEVSLVERVDGTLLAIARNQNKALEHTRATAVSHDGGETFEGAFTGVDDLLTTPAVQGASLRLRGVDEGDPYNRILFSSPVHDTLRKNLTIFSSFDEGTSWSTSTVLTESRAGYSDLVELGTGDVGVLYEGGAYPGGDARDEIRFRVVGEDELGEVPPGASLEDPPASVAIFTEGENGYFCFRIPTVVEHADGSLQAFAEGRKDSCGDTAEIDIVSRRSTDGGLTWGDFQVVPDGGIAVHHNPTAVVLDAGGSTPAEVRSSAEDGVGTAEGRSSAEDGIGTAEHDGRAVLVSTSRYRDAYVQISDDRGHTWTEPQLITPDIAGPDWHTLATGPGHAIQLRHGDVAGRVVVGVHYKDDPDDNLVLGGALIYSDDAGASWQLGASDSTANPEVRVQELSLAELPPEAGTAAGGDESPNGRILAIGRNEEPSSPFSRAAATSSDGGLTWDAPFGTIEGLESRIVQGSLLPFRSEADGDAASRLVYSVPVHPRARNALTLFTSDDDGATWEDSGEGKVVWWGLSAYSDLIRLGDDLGVAFEAGTAAGTYEMIRFARVTERALDAPNSPGPHAPADPISDLTTADTSEYGHVAALHGIPRLGGGRFGPGLTLDGVDDSAEVDVSTPLRLEHDDFTVAAWIRYEATAGRHAIFWAYGWGEDKTQVWLRGEPDADGGSLVAWVQTRNERASVSTPSALNDGAWHHVVLQRAGSDLRLLVDGAEAARADAPQGSVSIGHDFYGSNLHLGSRPDGADHFDGDLDEVSVYDRALDAGEIARLAAGEGPGGALLQLPFDTIER